MYLSADEILNANDLKRESVDVPEWGGTVLVQGMDGTSRDLFEAQMLNSKGDGFDKDKGMEMYRARLAAFCLVDESGKRLFQGTAVIKRLGSKSAQALTRVVDVATRLSGITDDDVEELTGN